MHRKWTHLHLVFFWRKIVTKSSHLIFVCSFQEKWTFWFWKERELLQQTPIRSFGDEQRPICLVTRLHLFTLGASLKMLNLMFPFHNVTLCRQMVFSCFVFAGDCNRECHPTWICWCGVWIWHKTWVPLIEIDQQSAMCSTHWLRILGVCVLCCSVPFLDGGSRTKIESRSIQEAWESGTLILINMEVPAVDSSNSSMNCRAIRCCANLRNRILEISPKELIMSPFRRWENESSHCEDNVCYAFSNFLGKWTLSCNRGWTDLFKCLVHCLKLKLLSKMFVNRCSDEPQKPDKIP